MNPLKSALFIFLFALLGCKDTSEAGIASITYKEEIAKFTPSQKQLIQEVVTDSEKEIRKLLPSLPRAIQLVVEIVDWDIAQVGGVTGRTETNSPPSVVIQISNKFPKGMTEAIHTTLKRVIFHEFHHLYRGWAIQDNTFDHGIDIAAINEGLAVVFSEEYTRTTLKTDSPPEEAIAHLWALELLALPKDANYGKWMFQHPDGRQAIGYRIGNFIVRKAMINSKKSILSLSKHTPEEILEMAGY